MTKINLQEFKESVIEEIKESAELNKNNISNEFIKYFTNNLKELEEFDDFTECYFEMIGLRKKHIKIDGYNFDSVDKSCMLLISDFNLEDDTMLNNKQISNLYSKVKAFIEHSVTNRISEEEEKNREGYEFAELIKEKISQITKFKVYIISNKDISERVKSIKKEDIYGVPVELNVWDIPRLYNLVKANMAKENIEIDFNDFEIKGLNSILAVDCENQNYKSYLTVIPGDILAKIYIEYGARLLEGNVRSFLSVRGKVNKEIRKTIISKPEMFFAYNNGIAATATSIETDIDKNGLIIKKLTNLQIINGGQTTASIANVVLQDDRDVSNIMVPMKLSIVNNEKAEEIIPTISRCANNQNKVDEADFFANHPYHIKIEELSRKIYAPAVKGNQFETIWFYERARGQHTQEQMKLNRTERKKYLLKNPKSQLIKKVDWAKYINTYKGYPHIVSKGSQANMRYFANEIGNEWKENSEKFDVSYYKKIISLAIIFKDTEKIVSNQDWYKLIKSYRANIVTYSLAIIFHHIKENLNRYDLDFKRIWNNQEIYKELEDQIIVTTREVYDFITREDRDTLNVKEWCKNDMCLERAKKEHWTINNSFVQTLISSN